MSDLAFRALVASFIVGVMFIGVLFWAYVNWPAAGTVIVTPA